MAGLQVTSDGKLVVTSDGKLVVAESGDPCCCASAGDPCGGITGTTPAQWTVTISGVNECPCSSMTAELLFDINGTWTLTQVSGSPCVWRYEVTADLYQDYTDSSCSTPNGAVANRTIRFNLELSSGTWDFRVGSTLAGEPVMFRRDNAAEATDGSDFTLTNSFDVVGDCAAETDPAFEVSSTYGGTAAFSAV